MGRLYTYITYIALLCSFAGCATLLQETQDQNVDADVLATYFDGPKVRPGVALAISVTATGTQGQAAKQYFVDADPTDEDADMIPLDYQLSAQAVNYDQMKPCYWQVLTYQCDTKSIIEWKARILES